LEGAQHNTSYVQPVPLGPHAAQAKVSCVPVWVFAAIKVSYILTTFPYFDNLEFDIFDAGSLLSATLSRLQTLKLGFERFHYISFRYIWFAQI